MRRKLARNVTPRNRNLANLFTIARRRLLSKHLYRRLGLDHININSRREFESRLDGYFGNHLDVPMVITVFPMVRGRVVDEKIQVGIVQILFHLFKNRLEEERYVARYFPRGLPKVGEVLFRQNAHLERFLHGVRHDGDRMLVFRNNPLFPFPLFLDNVASHTPMMFFEIMFRVMERPRVVGWDNGKREYLVVRVPNRGAGRRPPIEERGGIGSAFVFRGFAMPILQNVEYLEGGFSVEVGESLVVIPRDEKVVAPDAGFCPIHPVPKRRRAHRAMGKRRILIGQKYYLPTLGVRIRHERRPIAGRAEVFKRTLRLRRGYTPRFLFYELVWSRSTPGRHEHPIAREEVLSKFGHEISF